jgi:hypothetical protein
LAGETLTTDDDKRDDEDADDADVEVRADTKEDRRDFSGTNLEPKLL